MNSFTDDDIEMHTAHEFGEEYGDAAESYEVDEQHEDWVDVWPLGE